MNHLSRPLCTLLITVWAGFAGCAIYRGGAAKSPPEIAMNAAATGNTDRMQAIDILEGYLADAPDPDDTPWVMTWAGEQRRLAGDDELARQWWNMVVSGYPEHTVANAATLGLAVLNAREDPRGNVLATLQMIGDRGVPDTLNADRHRILARVAADDGASLAEIDELVAAAIHYAREDDQVRNRVEMMLSDLIPEDIEPVIEVRDPEASAATEIEEGLRSDQFEEVIEQGSTFLRTWPDSEHAQRIEYLIRRAEIGDPTEEAKVSVFLPLTGRFAPIGTQLRALIEAANSSLAIPMTLLFEDTNGGQPVPSESDEQDAEDESQDEAETEEVEEFDQAAFIRELTENAVLVEHSVAILGPILKENALIAAETAQALGVPMISLSRGHDLTSLGDFVFRGQLSDSDQVEAIVNHAVMDRGLNEFALVYPENSYGQEMRTLFENHVAALEGSLIHILSYDPNEPDFRAIAQELGQKDYEERAEEFRELSTSLERRGLSTNRVVLPPIIEFDGIFVADSWRRSAMLANDLAYEEFPVGDFLPDRNIPIIPLMGLNSWHDQRIIEIGGDYIQHATFVDAFSPTLSTPATTEWALNYGELFDGQTPMTLHAAIWDSTRLLASGILAGGPDRFDVRDALGLAEIEDAVSSGSRFDAQREIDRNLLLLTIEGEEIVPWIPPEIENAPGEEEAP